MKQLYKAKIIKGFFLNRNLKTTKMPDWYVTLLCLFSATTASTAKTPTHLVVLFQVILGCITGCYNALISSATQLLPCITA